MKNLPDWAKRARSQWEYFGQKRPSFAIDPAKGQESVWDYPRPPKIVSDSRIITVKHSGKILAKTASAIRILETASPPTFYLPPSDINFDVLKKATGASRCEWKGLAHYWDFELNDLHISDVAWSYPAPFKDYQQIEGYLAFYPSKVECFINDERVRPQPGGFYGGWITDEIVGPVKGEDPRAYL